jgi:hypothetical protein
MLYFITGCPRGRPLGHTCSDRWGVTFLDIWTATPTKMARRNPRWDCQWHPRWCNARLLRFCLFHRCMGRCDWKWRNKEWVLGAFFFNRRQNATHLPRDPASPMASSFGQPMLRVQVPPGKPAGSTLYVSIPEENRTIPAVVPPKCFLFSCPAHTN